MGFFGLRPSRDNKGHFDEPSRTNSAKCKTETASTHTFVTILHRPTRSSFWFILGLIDSFLGLIQLLILTRTI